MSSTPFAWLTLPTAITNIQDRLNDGGIFWSVAEIEVYLQEALSILNGLTESWRTEFNFNAQGSQWANLGTMANSPRLRSVTDADVATQMQYMLLEPPVGIDAWTGTNQFSVEKMEAALINRCNETIQVAACNTSQIQPIGSTPGTRRAYLFDQVLETRRIRFMALVATTTGTCGIGATSITVASTAGLYPGLVVEAEGPATGTIITSVGNGVIGISPPTIGSIAGGTMKFYQPYYLKRSDTQAFHYFNPSYLQESGTPKEWSIASEPPLAFDVDVAPTSPGYYEVLALTSNFAFGDEPTILSIPNDWCWGPMYGALADLLNEEPESKDVQRAAYCQKRYQDFLQMFRKANWFQQALINGAVADTPSLKKKDQWQIGWQEDGGSIPCVVTDGIDEFNVAPYPPCSVTMTVIQNAPFLDSTNTFVQVSRDDYDQVLNYVQHVASFKMGGQDFMATMPLLDEFLTYCVSKNKRQATYGLYVDVLGSAGEKQDMEGKR